MKIIKCTSTNCPIHKECQRTNLNYSEESYNFEYQCNEISGFDSFISKSNNNDSVINDVTLK